MKDQSEMSDEKLIRLYLNSSPAAMATLIELYKDRIYCSVLNMVQDKYAAEQIFNQVFVAIINDVMAGKISENIDFLQWSVNISHQLCIEHSRKIIPSFTNNNADAVCWSRPLNEMPFPYSINECHYHNTHTKIKTMISMLPEQQREVIALSHYAGLSYKEIADIMKCSLTSALDIMHVALNNLRKLMIEKEKLAA
jgi:RNA polymerase sigma factor (sigma-70 family)